MFCFPDCRGDHRVPGLRRGRGGRREDHARSARRRRPVKVGQQNNEAKSEAGKSSCFYMSTPLVSVADIECPNCF